MINVTFGAVGVTEFNAADFFFQTLVDTAGFEVSGSKLRLFGEDSKDYVELTGDFNTEGGKNPLSYVNELNGYKFVVDGKVNYQVSGLELSGTTLGSFKKLADYLDGNDYRVIGNDAANLLSGASGDDVLNGGKGNDRIVGNEGDDLLIGGAGRDRFVFHAGDGKDEIKDFVENGKLTDLIDLSEYGGKLRFRDIDIERHGKHDVVIEIGKHDEILLQDVNIKHITVADFDF